MHCVQEPRREELRGSGCPSQLAGHRLCSFNCCSCEDSDLTDGSFRPSRKDTPPVCLRPGPWARGAVHASNAPCVHFSPSLPALDWQLPSHSGPYELRIEVQPKSHHRAHYETEGSRGAVKASAGGHPSVQVPLHSNQARPCSGRRQFSPEAALRQQPTAFSAFLKKSSPPSQFS